jgi:hypothetical protein
VDRDASTWDRRCRRVSGLGGEGVTRVNAANVLDEGLSIGGRGRRMNSKVRIQTNKAKLDVY